MADGPVAGTAGVVQTKIIQTVATAVKENAIKSRYTIKKEVDVAVTSRAEKQTFEVRIQEPTGLLGGGTVTKNQVGVMEHR